MSRMHTYTIKGDETLTVEGRRKAVHRARNMSERTHRPVSVERTDRKMSMIWRRGNLQKFRLETR